MMGCNGAARYSTVGRGRRG